MTYTLVSDIRINKLGKSKLDGKEGQIRELLKRRVAKSAIARILRTSRQNLINFMRSRQIK